MIAGHARPDRTKVWRMYPRKTASSNAAAAAKTRKEISRVETMEFSGASALNENERPPNSTPIPAPIAKVTAPLTSPISKFTSDRFLNDAPRASNGRLSRYFPQSHPTKRAIAVDTTPLRVRKNALPAAAGPSRRVAIRRAAPPNTIPRQMKDTRKIANRQPERSFPSAPNKAYLAA